MNGFAIGNLQLAKDVQLAISNDAAIHSASLIANFLPMAQCQSLMTATKGVACA
ncbi:MAG: hypothetical protein WAQ57_02740 [Candidatus Saccharimonadales bacterium]